MGVTDDLDKKFKRLREPIPSPEPEVEDEEEEDPEEDEEEGNLSEID